MSTAPATFIVGHPRSGTSLLVALLDGHPDLLVLPFESHLFDWAKSGNPVTALLARTQLWPTLQRHRPSVSRDEVQDVLARVFREARDPRARLVALMGGWRELTEARHGTRWVEKTPRHLYESATLLGWFPSDARILVIRRDPRDVMASALKEKRSRTIFQMALTGRLAHEVVTEHELDSRFFVISYEELVEDPPCTMKEVCRFLDVPYDPVVVTPTVLGTDYAGNSRFESAQHGISTSGVGRYREVLAGPRLERAETLLAPVLSAGGYARTAPSPGSRHLIAGAAITTVLRSGLWRSRAVRAAFIGW